MDKDRTKQLVEGRVIGVTGRITPVQLEDGTTIKARFARRVGCIFGDVVGWQVQVRMTAVGVGTILQRKLT
jgi:hypothetical protein